MSRKRKLGSTDPRKAGGSMAGPGGPWDKNAVIVSMEHAVLLESTVVAEVETRRAGRPNERAIGMTLEGRINKTDERAEILYLFEADGAAAIITELLALATRMGPEVVDYIKERMARLKADDALGVAEVETALPVSDDLDEAKFKAAVKLIGHTGARSFRVGRSHEDDGDPVVWYATATFGGGVEAAAAPLPDQAVWRLAEQLIDGGTCTHCGRPTALVEEGEADLTAGLDFICQYRYRNGQIVRGCDSLPIGSE